MHSASATEINNHSLLHHTGHVLILKRPVHSVTFPSGNSTWYSLVSNMRFPWAFSIAFSLASLFHANVWPLAICPPYGNRISVPRYWFPPSGINSSSSYSRERFICSVSHPYMDYTVGYPLAIFSQSLLEGLMSLIWHNTLITIIRL